MPHHMTTRPMLLPDLAQVLHMDAAAPDPCEEPWFYQAMRKRNYCCLVANLAARRARTARIAGAIVYEMRAEGIDIHRLLGTPRAMDRLLDEVASRLNTARHRAEAVVSEWDDAAIRALHRAGYLGQPVAGGSRILFTLDVM